MLVLALRKIILFVCNSFFILNCRSLELFTFAQAHSSVVLPLVSALWKTIVMDYDYILKKTMPNSTDTVTNFDKRRQLAERAV